ncbi:hypothetical protein D3C77_331460 [compost metagenome]
MWQMFFGDSTARIAYAQCNAARSSMDSDKDCPSAWAVSDRVGKKVRDCTLNHQPVPLHYVRAARDLQLDFTFLSRDAEKVAHPLNFVHQHNGLEIDQGSRMADLG